MADYWKSQPRKFCEFCKCWIADNKPSRDFHEKGKKHQENVKHKISQVMKKGVTDAKKESDMNATLKRMEQAAMKALKKDVQRDPSLAAQYGVKMKDEDTNPTAQIRPQPQPKPQPRPRPQPKPQTKPQPKPQPSLVPESSSNMPDAPESTDENVEVVQTEDPNEVWKEEWTPEGYVYYWHIHTGESKWVKPDGYIPTWERAVQETETERAAAESPSVEDNRKEDVEEELTDKEDEKSLSLPPDATAAATTTTPTAESESSSTAEVENYDSVKKVTEPEVKDPMPSATTEAVLPEIALPSNIPLPGEVKPAIQRPPRPAAASAYGSWEVVQKPVEQKPVDLQLPVDKHASSKEVKSIPISEPKIKFRQKKVDTLGAEFVAFKKRKLNAAKVKANSRMTDTEKD